MYHKVFSFKITYMIIITLTILFSLLFTLRVYGNGSTSEKYGHEFKIVTVKSDDTLWSITKNNCNNYKDIRKAIYEIKKINNLDSANIFPGQTIKIPVELYK